MTHSKNISQPPWTTRHVIIFLCGLILFEMMVKTYLNIFEFPVTFLSDIVSIVGIESSQSRDASTLILIAFVRICMLSALFHFIRVHWKSNIQQVGIQRKNIIKDSKLSILFILSLAAVSVIPWALLFFIHDNDISTVLVPGTNALKYFRNPAYITIYFLVACVIAVFAEEVVFRGFIYPPLRNKMTVLFGKYGIPIAVVLNVALFTTAHIQWGSLEIYTNAVSSLFTSGFTRETLIAFQQAFLPLTQPLVCGILCCALFELTGRITAPFLLHFAGNTGILVVNVIHALGSA